MKYLIHYVILLNGENKISGVFSSNELPSTWDGHLDIEKFCDQQLQKFIDEMEAEHEDLQYDRAPEIFVVSISPIPRIYFKYEH